MSTSGTEMHPSGPAPGGRRRWKRWLSWGVVGLVVLFGLIQLVPYGRAKNPPVTKAAAWPNAQAQTLAENGCYDCHSNLTKQWWATEIAPASWLAQSDVDGGRNALNFSEWDKPQAGLDDVDRSRAVRLHAADPVQALSRERTPQRCRAPAARRRAHAAVRHRPAGGHQARWRLSLRATAQASTRRASPGPIVSRS